MSDISYETSLYFSSHGLVSNEDKFSAYNKLLNDINSAQPGSKDFIDFLQKLLSRVSTIEYSKSVISKLVDKHSELFSKEKEKEKKEEEMDTESDIEENENDNCLLEWNAFRRNVHFIFKVLSIFKNQKKKPPNANDIVKKTENDLLNMCYNKRQKKIIYNIEKEQFSSIMSQKKPEEMADGVLECPMCRRDPEKRKNKLTMKTDYYERQTRSADEPATIFAMCYLCKYSWKR